jgi:uncharacterized protein YabE (DUF348 family)
LRPEDIVSPSLTGPLTANQPVQIKLAQPIVVDMGAVGHLQPRTIYTHQQTPREIYQELGIELTDSDDVYVNTIRWSNDEPVPKTLPKLSPMAVSLRSRLEALRPEPVRLILRQSVPITLIDDERELIVDTTEQTVGDLLVARNIPLYQGDAITPDLSQPLTADTVIAIERSVPVVIQVDGKTIQTRSRFPTIGQALAEEGVALIGQDYTVPAVDAVVDSETPIQVIRVTEVLDVEKETTDFETIWIADPKLELDTQRIEQEGQLGVTKTRTRVRYENGQEISRVEEDTWLESSPADKVIAYGTQVVVRTGDTPGGTVQYWRKVRMLATSYSAATSGKSADHPRYGITRTGVQAGYGVVAVDPAVVPLRSYVFVPSYGTALAGDTGGAILGKHIDLGFDEDVPPLWYRWVEVYLLAPAPPAGQIRYVLPQWPQER